MKRTVVTATLVCALLLTAGAAYAQEDVTLAHVWRTVQGMQADFRVYNPPQSATSPPTRTPQPMKNPVTSIVTGFLPTG